VKHQTTTNILLVLLPFGIVRTVKQRHSSKHNSVNNRDRFKTLINQKVFAIIDFYSTPCSDVSLHLHWLEDWRTRVTSVEWDDKRVEEDTDSRLQSNQVLKKRLSQVVIASVKTESIQLRTRLFKR
jgi:hypothetical protein